MKLLGLGRGTTQILVHLRKQLERQNTVPKGVSKAGSLTAVAASCFPAPVSARIPLTDAVTSAIHAMLPILIEANKLPSSREAA